VWGIPPIGIRIDLYFMDGKKPEIFIVPVGEKYLVYAPLKQLAFIGNSALVNAINDQLNNRNKSVHSDHELILALKKTRLFEPDTIQFSDYGTDQPFRPALCILMPTTACNLACTYCYAAYEGKKTSALKWPVAKRAIDIAYENSAKEGKDRFALSYHGGGEPTLNQRLFFKAAQYARKLDANCPISVTTNAVWDKDFRDRALELLNGISISFDGNETTQNRQRPDHSGTGTFSRVMETIREIEKRELSYGIRMTVTRESLPALRSNMEFMMDQTNCKSFQVEPVYNQGRAAGAGITIHDVDQFVEVFMDIHQYAKKTGRTVNYSSARPHLTTNTFCTAPYNALIVTSDGNLTACYEVFDHSHALADDFLIGRIDLKEGAVLFPGKRENLLRKISENREACKDCFCYYHCAGDCPPKAFLSHQNNDTFRCMVTKAITRELILEKIIESDGFWSGNETKKPI
jgi:uncharacterized protein